MPRLSEEKKAVLEAMTRDALYKAARELLEEEGWRGMTMERLASRAGMAKGTVYNYFPNKREIIFFVIERNTLPIREMVRKIDLDTADPLETLRTVIHESLQGMYRNRRSVVALIRAFHEDAELKQNHFCEEKHPMWEVRVFVRETIRRGVERGIFRNVDPFVAESAIHFVIMGMARQLVLGAPDIPLDEFGASLGDIVLNGIIARGESKE